MNCYVLIIIDGQHVIDKYLKVLTIYGKDVT
jgi:hypothetical protein